MKSILTLAIILFLSACAAKKQSANTQSGILQSDVERGEAKFPGTTLETLNIGKKNFESHCQSCHSLESPTSQTEDKWKVIVPSMVKKANQKAGKTVVDTQMQESILRYLITMGSAPKK